MKPNLSRKDFLSLAGSSAAAWTVSPLLSENYLPRLTFFSPPGQEPQGDVLVVVFQRGGMDALNAVIPHFEEEYYRKRSSLAIAEPNSGDDNSGIDLDGQFGLHPSLRPLKDLWDAQSLAIVHAVGSPDPTHSHFDAMDFMERGTPGEKSISTGWLARHLQTVAWENESPFRAVGIGNMLQSSLRGPVSATSMRSIAEFHLGGSTDSAELLKFQAAVAEMYGQGSMLDPVANLTLDATGTLTQVIDANYTPNGGAEYPQSQFGQALLQVAQLIKAEVGLEVAAVDIGGWDTHATQGALDGAMPDLLSDFANSMAAFYADLGDLTKRVIVVSMSEFGRRLEENASGGTDHGHGGVMFVMGNNVNGGKVYGNWPGLAPENLYGPGDLQITTDFRDVLGEIVQTRLKNDKLSEVFPGYTDYKNLGILKT
ncbi:MAG: DUF1501 domain-containing protein [Chloroflexi bacterium]|nr:MAG: DUF1501 domain-containing protein [Chloroflexota bacterium]MBL1195827.1 DUF1501 domain-containing protein [Chloroflexota bacterium]NOH13119.1 DUF1501 domain-containing protein [Chloroflexota bacterium]